MSACPTCGQVVDWSAYPGGEHTCACGRLRRTIKRAIEIRMCFDCGELGGHRYDTEAGRTAVVCKQCLHRFESFRLQSNEVTP